MSDTKENGDLSDAAQSDANPSLNSLGQEINDGTAEADTSKKSDKQKIDILLKPTGNAPIMKKKKWSVDADKQISWIIEFLKKYLKLEPQERLFLYVNQTFAPSPDQTVRNLYECYNAEGKLVLHYCKTQAWG